MMRLSLPLFFVLVCGCFTAKRLSYSKLIPFKVYSQVAALKQDSANVYGLYNSHQINEFDSFLIEMSLRYSSLNEKGRMRDKQYLDGSEGLEYDVDTLTFHVVSSDGVTMGFQQSWVKPDCFYYDRRDWFLRGLVVDRVLSYQTVSEWITIMNDDGDFRSQTAINRPLFLVIQPMGWSKGEYQLEIRLSLENGDTISKVCSVFWNG